MANPEKADRHNAQAIRVEGRALPKGKALSSQDCCAIEEYPTALGPAIMHLSRRSRCPIVEAKKLTLGPQNVLSQAERDSKGIAKSRTPIGEFGVPFLYSTNGEVIWHHDVRNPLNRSAR